MPPLEAYRFKPYKTDLANTEGDNNKRAVFYGWNNINDYERAAIRDVKAWLIQSKKVTCPAAVSDRDILKFI